MTPVETAQARRIELGILLQDLALELLQGPARIETQLLCEDPSTLLVHLQRLSLASRTVQRQHVLCAQSLPERVGLDEPLQLHDKGRVPPAREVCFDTLLERREPELLQTRDLRLGEGLICELRQGWTSPELEGCAKRGRGTCGITCRECRPSLFDKPLKPRRVELARPTVIK